MNVSKTQLMVLSRRCRKREVEHICIQHDGSMLVGEEKVRYLGCGYRQKPHLERLSAQNQLGEAAWVVWPNSVRYDPFSHLYNAPVLPYMDYWTIAVLSGWNVGQS